MRYKKEYKAIQVKQQPDAAPFFLLSVEACEILEWADAPRKKANYMAGYQRELGERHKKIARFIELDPKNVVPGAVIIAVQEGCFEVEELEGDVCNVSIFFETSSLEEQVQCVFHKFYERLNDTEKESIKDFVDLDETEDFVVPEDDDDDSSEPDSYLARLTAELSLATRDDYELPEARRDAIEDYVKGVSKPGLILDGQHRVFGAKEVNEFEVNLPVVLMPGLPYAEQVFHFYVLNNKAQPLRPTELRATISTSLTNGEIEELYDRLKKSGVKAEEAKWSHELNKSPGSPFFNLIDFGFQDSSGVIPENVAFQVVSKFMKLAKKYRLLYKNVKEWEDSNYRMELFFTIWQVIKDKYGSAWKAASSTSQNDQRQIFYKATMLCLQELILDKLVGLMPAILMRNKLSPFSDPEELKIEVESVLFFLPEDFFTRTWTETGLDTAEGRKFLKKQMEEAINKQGEGLGYLKLFRAKSS